VRDHLQVERNNISVEWNNFAIARNKFFARATTGTPDASTCRTTGTRRVHGGPFTISIITSAGMPGHLRPMQQGGRDERAFSKAD
jgi:hypothetical protein